MVSAVFHYLLTILGGQLSRRSRSGHAVFYGNVTRNEVCSKNSSTPTAVSQDELSPAKLTGDSYPLLFWSL